MQLPIQQRLDDFRHQSRVQAGSLIISLFGDAVVPRGSRIWLGSLIRLLEPLGLNERLIRTSVYRLAKEDWLHAEPCGRRTDYLLTPFGQRRFDEASRQIYACETPPWDRRWRLIIVLGELGAKQREKLRVALQWHGFGTLNGECFVHPSADLGAAFDALISEGLSDTLDKLKPLLAADAQFNGAADDIAMIRKAWNLARLADAYEEFVARYQPALAQLRGDGPIDDESAFLLRLLLIHDYRRLLLRDPELPDVLLPAAWPGQKARLLCKAMYRRLLPPSESHLDLHFQLADGEIPRASGVLRERFREADPLSGAA